MSVVGPARLWVNPDCGLKTRGYAETDAALRNLVAAARQARATVAWLTRGNRRPALAFDVAAGNEGRAGSPARPRWSLGIDNRLPAFGRPVRSPTAFA